MAIFPLTVLQMRSAINVNNLQPQVVQMQHQVKALRDAGNFEAGREKMVEMAKFMSTNDINPLKMIALSVVPIPLFMSTFLALRSMASQPVGSLLDGGVLWFTNLSIPDPYYILPAMSTAALVLSLKARLVTYAMYNLPLFVPNAHRMTAATASLFPNRCQSTLGPMRP